MDYDDPTPNDICPVCLDPIDYCQGHGEIGDPYGYEILQDYFDEESQ